MSVANLKPCPFCGSPAELYSDRTFPKNKKRFDTEAAANEYLERCRNQFEVKTGYIHQIVAYKSGKTKYRVVFERAAYIPRCTTVGCLGRGNVMFNNEKDAVESWNRRLYEKETY